MSLQDSYAVHFGKKCDFKKMEKIDISQVEHYYAWNKEKKTKATFAVARTGENFYDGRKKVFFINYFVLILSMSYLCRCRIS